MLLICHSDQQVIKVKNALAAAEVTFRNSPDTTYGVYVHVSMNKDFVRAELGKAGFKLVYLPDTGSYDVRYYTVAPETETVSSDIGQLCSDLMSHLCGETVTANIHPALENITVSEPRHYELSGLTKREHMLCEQVLRMCRDESSEIFDIGLDVWREHVGPRYELWIDQEYRAKPKEVVVPWKWLPDDVISLEVCSDGDVIAHLNDGQYYPLYLKIDLEGIELPVTVKRPCE